ncbi:MAG: hypothetical protein ACI4I6_06655, partial [Hominimerdicola sp.]
MKKAVMTRAWEIYRTLEGDRAAKLSQALRIAWEEVKKECKFIKAGFKVWAKDDKRRIYINNAFDFVNIERGEVVYSGRKDIIIDGFSIWDDCTKASQFNQIAKKMDYNEFSLYGCNLYYNCHTGFFYWRSL